jgi:transcriptional regulator with XRE-family HTH domain
MKFASLANSQHLSNRIRQARKRAHLSQAALGKRTAVSASAVSQWEHPNGTKPDLERLVSIASATGVAVEWLITGKGNPGKVSPSSPEVPALASEAFAHSMIEEQLLTVFRSVSPRAGQLLLELIDEISPRAGRRKIKQR